MWQQVSRDLQQVKAWLTQAPTFFSVITVLPGCFQLCSSQELADICVPEAYFLRKRRSFCAGYFIVNRSFPALCEQESDDSIGGFFFFFPPDIYHDWSDWSFAVRGSCSTPSPADRVNISSSCHYKLLSQPFKLSWWQCCNCYDLLYKLPCSVAVVISFLCYFKIRNKKMLRGNIMQTKTETVLISTPNIPNNMSHPELPGWL